MTKIKKKNILKQNTQNVVCPWWMKYWKNFWGLGSNKSMKIYNYGLIVLITQDIFSFENELFLILDRQNDLRI